MAKDKFYVTTAIDYVNAEPHIGHAYQKIVADVLARWNSLQGKDVWFLTGTDEHGKKVEEAAKAAGKDTKKFVDLNAEKFKVAWDVLNVRPNRFIRTTDRDHQEFVKGFIKKCEKKGDIYKDSYEGFYCVGCEAYKTEKDLVDFECEFHPGKRVEKIKEESYFFRLSNYQDFLLKLYKEHPEFIQPKSRRNEIINRVKEGLKDLSITRTSFKWGIPFPLEPESHITYVWFDALLNYLTGAGKSQEFWPADVHLLGKDNTWFHTVYWPAMLKSAGYELPKVTYNHGFISFNGQKISKSLGNAISPVTLVEKYGADSVRYFCLRHFPFASGDDGDFDEKALVDRHNNELGNKLGNLVSRVAGLIEKNGIEKCKNSLKIDVDKVKKLIDGFEFDKALNEIFAFVDVCNEYVQNKKPWETKDKTILFELACAIKDVAILLSPFMPETCDAIAKKFDFKIGIKELKKPLSAKAKITKGDNLFSRLEYKEDKKTEGKVSKKINKEPVIKEIMESNSKNSTRAKGTLPEGVGTIAFEDWAKVDLRVGEIEKAEDLKGADLLYKLTVNLGTESRTILSGLKEFYSKDDLQGMKIIVIANLAPRKMRGVMSEGMLLAAVNDDDSKVILIGPTSNEAEPGMKVS
jgi:methionyl-tRNA synthetase